MSKDLFSVQADTYARYRPSYPAELFDYIFAFVKNRSTALDCATGNGQAALKLAESFIKVVATDISEKQLALAPPRENIEYVVCRAEHTPLPDSSVDLITVAQAYHWFHFDDFEKEARRVGKPGAVIAIWGYSLTRTHHAAIDEITQRFYHEVVGPYWDAERKYVEEHYRTVPFNFTNLPSREFSIDAEWTREDMLGYLNSWSSVQHFVADKNYNPVNDLGNELALYWKDNERLPVSFPLFLRLGKLD